MPLLGYGHIGPDKREVPNRVFFDLSYLEAGLAATLRMVDLAHASRNIESQTHKQKKGRNRGPFNFEQYALLAPSVLGNQCLGAIEHLLAVMTLGVHVSHP